MHATCATPDFQAGDAVVFSSSMIHRTQALRDHVVGRDVTLFAIDKEQDQISGIDRHRDLLLDVGLQLRFVDQAQATRIHQLKGIIVLPQDSAIYTRFPQLLS